MEETRTPGSTSCCSRMRRGSDIPSAHRIALRSVRNSEEMVPRSVYRVLDSGTAFPASALWRGGGPPPPGGGGGVGKQRETEVMTSETARIAKKSSFCIPPPSSPIQSGHCHPNRRLPSTAGLFPDHLDDDLPRSLSIVEIDEDDLLPGSECHFLLQKWDGEGRLQQGRPDVGESVSVAPAPVVLVGDVR